MTVGRDRLIFGFHKIIDIIGLSRFQGLYSGECVISNPSAYERGAGTPSSTVSVAFCFSLQAVSRNDISTKRIKEDRFIIL